MARAVQNNPPRPHPRATQQHRAREGRTSATQSSGPSTGTSRLPPALLVDLAQGLEVAGSRRRGPRRARDVFRDAMLQDLHTQRAQDAEIAPSRRRNGGRRRAGFALRERDASRQVSTSLTDDFFERARDEYMASLDEDVRANMDDSVNAMREVIEEIMQRPDTGPGLVPDDVALLMGRGVYATAAIALTHALPALCRHRGFSCGLRLFEEQHMTPNPERQQVVLKRVFEACRQLCDVTSHAAMAIEMHAWVPTLIKHIDEDTQPESELLQQVMREVFYAVREVKGALLTSVIRAASEGLESDSGQP